MLVLLIRKEEGRSNTIKEELKFVIMSIIIWGIGYSCMWILKWTLSAIVLDASIIESIKSNALLRINGNVGESTLGLYTGAILKNIYALFPINIVQRKWKFIIPAVIIALILWVLVDRKKLKGNKFLNVIMLIAIVPYARYLVLANHSYRHYFFTFRAQMVTIIGIIYIFCEIVDKQKLKKIWNFLNREIKLKGVRKE